MREKLPNSTASLVLGIFSIITCWCYGLPGVILGVFGLLQGKKAVKLHNEDPELYEGIGNAKAGKIMSIIGIVLSIIFIGYVIWLLSYIGWENISDPELLQEKIRELQQR